MDLAYLPEFLKQQDQVELQDQTTSWLGDRKQLEKLWRVQRDQLKTYVQDKVPGEQIDHLEKELRELNDQTTSRLYKNDPKMRQIKTEFYKEWKRSKEECVMWR